MVGANISVFRLVATEFADANMVFKKNPMDDPALLVRKIS